MVRKLAVALFAASSLSASIAQALGLGEVTVNSSLNQPLDAQIALVNTAGLEPSEIVTALASSEAFSRASIDRSFFLTDVRFKVEWKNTGNAVIRMTSSKPVREPYLNFLIEVNWPSGRLLREYALLIDPPTYSLDDTTASAPVQTVASESTASQKSRASSTNSAAKSSSSQQGGSASAGTGAGSASSYGPIRSDETMWEIALKTRPNSSVSPQQMMLAIQDLNPGAFVNDNLNLVKRGQVLAMPDEQSILERDRRAAIEQFAVQNKAFQSADSSTPSKPSKPSKPGEQMTILAGGKNAAVGADTNSGEGIQAGSSLRADRNTDLLEENLDEQSRANEELSSKLAAVEEQLRTAELLVKLKDDQLAVLQAQLAGSQSDDAQSGSENDTSESSAAGESTFTDEVDTAGSTSAEDGATNAAVTDSSAADQSSMSTDPDLMNSEGADSDASSSAAPDVNAADAAAENTDSKDTDSKDASLAASGAATGQSQLAEEKPAVKSQPKPVSIDAEPESFLDMIASNPVYQIALAGGALLLLLGLWALSRRKASREVHYYEEPEGVEEYGGPSKAVVAASRAGLSGAAAAAAADESNPIAAADVYLAYDREDQARQVLEDAIAESPDNQRYRVKLMEVLGMAGEMALMQTCYDQIMRGEDEDAIVDAQALMSRFGDMDSDQISAPDSMDDDDFTSVSDGGALSDADLDDVFGSNDSTSAADLDLSFDAEPETTTPSSAKIGSPLAQGDQELENDDDSFASLLEDDTDIDDASTGEISFELDEDELNSLDLESDNLESNKLENVDVDDDLDVDFTVGDLDLGDATGSTASGGKPGAELLDLGSLDSVDGDRALSGTDGSLDRSLQDAEEAANKINESLQDPVELDLDEASLELDELSAPVNEVDDGDIELDSLDQVEALDQFDEQELELDDAAADAGEADELDEDFDFLSDTDEAATKLDLARAYLDMGDKDGARDILLEVVDEGNSDQKTEANELLDGL